MNNQYSELIAAIIGLVILVAMFAWFALLPAIGFLWMIGWLT